MNPVERALYQELTQLLDRLAGSVPEGSLDKIRAANPTLRARLDDADTNLAQARESPTRTRIWHRPASRCSRPTAAGGARWRTSRTSGRSAPGGQPRPKSRPSRPRRSPPEPTRSAVYATRMASKRCQ